MSTALYRRYRPETFAEVIGQDHVTDPLKAALKANRVTHAYLFSGPRGCGKTTSARILARCLNCVEGPTDNPCGKCDSCVELATGGTGSLDVVEIDAASHNGVDDARELRERAAFAPARDRYKVFILDEAHMVTAQGFNALLKLVEEPPEHVKFVFATTEPERVIGTIRSRTHHYPFRLVPADVLTPYLQSLCDAEKISVAPGVLSLVVRAGGGSVRDSLSVLDQLMAGAQASEISYERAVALLGYTDGLLLDDIVTQLHAGNGSAVFASLEKMIDSGHDPRRFVEDFLQRLRDLLLISLAPEGAKALLQGIPAEQAQAMYQQASQWGPASLSKAADLTDEALRSMVGATSPKLQVELLIGRILVETGRLNPGIETSAQTASAPENSSQPRGQIPAENQGLSGAALAREELRRQREKNQQNTPVKEEPVEPVSAEAASMVETSAAGLGYSIEPLEAEIKPVPVVEPEATVVAPEPVKPMERPQLSQLWVQFTQRFLAEHSGWKNVVAALKIHKETEQEITFQLPTIEQAEKLSQAKPTALVEQVIAQTLGEPKRAKFVGPLVVAEEWEPEIAAEEPIATVSSPAPVVRVYQPEPSYQLEPSYSAESAYPAESTSSPESVSQTESAYSAESASLAEPIYQPEPVYQVEPVYTAAPQYSPEPDYSLEPDYSAEAETPVNPNPGSNYSAPTENSFSAAPTEINSATYSKAETESEVTWEDETQGATLADADAGNGIEMGIPVVQKVFGAVVINELREGE
ncbi:DNA polymerase III subunit gamma and tau [Gleimia sp. 6138-11-ORH1]|uniref:DNA polymerase III subunit gamma and tau n=1 Tax=Gleimia sp. 6138-11-ORH1 TaxID=2973937 RepID=UPI002167EC59|nr:DNA polymerase III subunit gamma and tau [Gleimia sp. 6138-11-ORH1]MCS4484722.1 DNA polymerase III subunit gamma and tau [Gleimia sp. 6138-11-ORH1]